MLLDETQRGTLAQIFGHPVEEVASRGVLVHQFLLRLAGEAEQLIDAWR
jgi:hypothetical protein